MAKSGSRCKEYMMNEISNRLSGKQIIFFLGFSELTVRKTEELRSVLKPVACSFMVAKKSIIERALREFNISRQIRSFNGSLAFTVGGLDPISVSKILVAFSKQNPTFGIQGGILDGHLLLVDAVKELAALPSKDELIRRVLCGAIAPVVRFVNVLGGSLRNLVYVLKQIK